MAAPQRVSTSERRLAGLLALVVVLAAAAGAIQAGWHALIFLGRAGFPLDLEWMEGGTLLHAQRIALGLPLYTAPTVDFVPFLYPPLYPAVLAVLSKIFALGYTLGRAVSLLALAGSLTLLAAAASQQVRYIGNVPGGRVHVIFSTAALVGVAGAGVVVSGYRFTGTFYDLARADSLLLFLQAAALYAACCGTGKTSAALAGVAIAAAFFTKQTASVMGVAIGLGLLLSNWRRAIVYGAVAAAVLGTGIAWLTAASKGWFWTYIWKAHQSHTFNHALAWKEAPLRIGGHEAFLLGALALLVAGMALAGKWRRSDFVLVAAALAGLVSACVGFGTQWAFDNAFMPALYFPAFAAACFAARLAAAAVLGASAGLLGPGLLPALACLGVLGLGAQSLAERPPAMADVVPHAGDYLAAGRFLSVLRSLPGDGFIPFHPYYSVLAGKRPFLHRMGVMDVASFAGRPAGLDEAVEARRFPFIVLDWKSQPREWPFLEQRYRVVYEFTDGVDAVRSFSGAVTSPRTLLLPIIDPPPLPAGGLRIADFENETWNGWTATGSAFGLQPAPAPGTLFGRHAADSGRFGLEPTGTLRSPAFTITRPHLRFSWSGSPDAALRVLLLNGPETARAATLGESAAAATIAWDVSDLMGRQVVFAIEDQSPTASVAVDDIVVF